MLDLINDCENILVKGILVRITINFIKNLEVSCFSFLGVETELFKPVL